MNKIFRSSQLTPYEADYAQWCAEQGALLREGRFANLDRENLAEEIESLGRNEKSEIESRMGVLLLHLLKYRFQPDARSSGWRGTILEQRHRLARRLKDSPSLKGYPSEILDEEYELARLKASGETGLPESIFPEKCPFSLSDILDPGYLPE